MLAFISCAKTMAARCTLRVPQLTTPRFEAEALQNALSLSQYTGAVFKRIAPRDFTADDFAFAQDHLLITSFLYGLLRPLDGIRPYRLEGDVCLPERGGLSMFDYWKPLLTDVFIEAVRQQGGVLLNLASGEMKNLFDWRRVEREVQVVTPEFQVWKGGWRQWSSMPKCVGAR